MKLNRNGKLFLLLVFSLFFSQIIGCSSSGNDSPSGTSSNNVVVVPSTATISLTADPISVNADGISSITISSALKTSAGQPVPQGTSVSFTTNLGVFSTGSTSYSTQTSDSSGSINLSLKAGTISGIASVSCNSNGITQWITIEFKKISAPGNPASIQLTPNTDTSPNPNPNPVYIKNSGRPESSAITFDVKDQNGTAVADGHKIYFSIDGGGVGGGEYLTESSTNTINGKISATLKSGTISGAVKIKAEYNSSIFTIATVTIAGGPPYGEHLGVDPQSLNIEGLMMHGMQDIMTTRVTDIYSNNVPDGISVYFKTDNLAGITASDLTKSKDASGKTITSYASAVLTSQTPDPPDGFVTAATSTQSGSYARVLCMAVDPKNNSIIYLGTDGGGIFKTTDMGVTWKQLGKPDTGMTNGIVRDIKFVDPDNNTAILIAATDFGIFETTGGGDKWFLISWFKEIRGESLGDIDTTDDGSGYTKAYQLQFPSNGIRPKTHVYLDGIETRQYIFSSANLIRFIIGGVGFGQKVTIDYETNYMIPSNYRITSLAIGGFNGGIDPLKNRIIYASTNGKGVYKSLDGGFSWNAMNSGLSVQDVNCLTIIPKDDTKTDIIYAGTNGGGIFKTEDGAGNWKTINKNLPGSVINDIAIDPYDLNRLYAATEQYGVYVYYLDIDKKETEYSWKATEGIDTKQVTSFVINKLDDKDNKVQKTVMYAGTIGDGKKPLGGVYRCISDELKNNGLKWTRLTDLPDNHVLSLEIIPGTKNNSFIDIIFAGTWGRNFIISPTSGTLWEKRNGASPNELTNNIFATARVLFTDDTILTAPVQTDTSWQKAGGVEKYSNNWGRIYNGGIANFIFTVQDFNGNPLIKDTNINVSVDNGQVSGNIDYVLPDGQINRNYYVTWKNNITGDKNITGNLTISITSKNGNIKGSITRELVRPLQANISPTAPVTGDTVTVIPKGGSETDNNLGGGYNVRCYNGTIVPCKYGDSVQCTAGNTPDKEENVIVTDNVNGSQTNLTYTVKAKTITTP